MTLDLSPSGLYLTSAGIIGAMGIRSRAFLVLSGGILPTGYTPSFLLEILLEGGGREGEVGVGWWGGLRDFNHILE